MTSVLGRSDGRARGAATAGILALAEGTGSGAGARLAPGVEAWLASPEDGLKARIESVRGVEQTRRALGRLAPSSLAVAGAAASESAYWAEVERRAAGGQDETCLVGMSFEPAGRVSRLVWLRAPRVPARDLDPGTGAPDARPVLEGYFADLMSSRFRQAAARFTRDTIYSHPPYAGGSARVLFEGREALWRGFARERGPSPARQIITDLWQQGAWAFVEGVVEGIPDGGTFFSTAQITDEGEIARYVAFYAAATRVPRR